MLGPTDAKPTGAAANAVAGNGGPKRQRTRSPSYPFLDLRAALDKAVLLWHAEGRHAVSVSLAMQHWGYKADSSTGYSCIAALKKFGLVDEEGTGDGRAVRLSRLGLAILLDEDEASPERNAALKQAALGPRIHAELWEKYGPDLPSDSSLRRFLVIEKNFNDAAVEEFLEEYKATIAFASLAAGDHGAHGASVATTLPRRVGSLAAMPAARGDRLAARAAAPAAVTAPHSPRHPPLRNEESQGQLPERRATGETGFLFPVAETPVAPLVAPSPSGGAAQRPANPVLPAGTPMADSREEHRASDKQPPQELTVPLENGSVVRVPYPMSEEDFALLLETLQLWKKRLVVRRAAAS